MLGRSNGRPSRREIEPVALALLQRRGPEILATARRWSATPEDAEDAYQRALEILLTKAPSTREEELVPWLKTVVKHEAFAVRRQRERHTPAPEGREPADPPAADAATHHQAERYERLRLGAEALGRLKPHEIRCLVLKAQGLSYKEICAATGFSYTKVNRCLTEGRRAFLERLAGIESGKECERLAPLLSALADGEASAGDLAALRPHLKTCLSCRARLREFRAAPARVAALVPPAVLASQADVSGPLRSFVESLIGAAQERAAALGERAHTAAELATGQKVAAVAASAAALAGGGAATVEQLEGRGDGADGPVATRPVAHETRPVDQSAAATPPPAASVPATAPPAPAPKRETHVPPPPDPANEFAPPAAAASAAPPPASETAAPSVGGAGSGSASGGGGEFAP